MTDTALAPLPPAPAQRKPLLARRFTVEVRQQMSAPRQAAILALSVIVGMGLSAAVLVAAGVPAAELFDEFVLQTLVDRQSLLAVLFQAAPMILVGIGASIAFRARFWNLGLEGQMIAGGIGATALSMYEIGPPSLRLPLMALVAMAMGLAWALVPVLLKLKLEVNEIISSLMLNYVAGNVVLHLVYGAWKDPKDAFPYSPQFRAFERLPEWFGSVGTAALALAVVAALVAAWFTGISRAGLYLRFIDANPRVARALGVPVARMVMAAVLLSAALAGLAGFVVVSGQEGRLTQAFYSGYGFSGVLIAFLARNNPLAASVVAVLMAMLFVAGRNLQVFYQIPFAMVQLIQAIVVICVASSDFFIRHRVRAVVARADD